MRALLFKIQTICFMSILCLVWQSNMPEVHTSIINCRTLKYINKNNTQAT